MCGHLGTPLICSYNFGQLGSHCAGAALAQSVVLLNLVVLPKIILSCPVEMTRVRALGAKKRMATSAAFAAGPVPDIFALAYQDSLTGIANRSAFEVELDDALGKVSKGELNQIAVLIPRS